MQLINVSLRREPCPSDSSLSVTRVFLWSGQQSGRFIKLIVGSGPRSLPQATDRRRFLLQIRAKADSSAGRSSCNPHVSASYSHSQKYGCIQIPAGKRAGGDNSNFVKAALTRLGET